MRSDKIGSERHQRSDQSPCYFNFYPDYLDVMFASTFKKLRGHVEYFRANIVGNVERSVEYNRHQSHKSICMFQSL